MNSWLDDLAWKTRYLANRRRVRVQVDDLDAQIGSRIAPTCAESLVIPVAGADYIEEGTLSAVFADRFYPELKEIVLVSDSPDSAFCDLPPKAVVRTMSVDDFVPTNHAYKAIYRSRLIKILAPLQARFERVLMIDSDMMILKGMTMPYADNCVFGSFRRGKMISKVRKGGGADLSELRGTFRPFLWDHLNGAFLAATRSTWKRLTPAWIAAYLSIWSKLPDDQPPTDQLPLCCVLDHLGLITVDLGDWVNWPVSKKIGGFSASVPPEVIGAHGGFPLAEWRRYLDNRDSALNFIDPEKTRKLRYLTDTEKDRA